MLTFLTAWNEFFWPIIALTTKNPTVQVALAGLGSGYVPQQSVIMAGTLLGTLPVLVVFTILGIGSTGHIGFNEPTSSLSSRTRIKTLTPETRRDNARIMDPAPRGAAPQHDPVRSRPSLPPERGPTPWRP